MIVDGFGIGPVPADDAIASARMPAWRTLLAEWPHTLLRASEDAVGLPPGQMGNSEVGHLNLGAGRPVVQDLPRIDAAIADRSFFDNAVLVHAVDAARAGTGRLHLVGLIGPGGVHSNDRHAVALAARHHPWRSRALRSRAARRARHAAALRRRSGTEAATTSHSSRITRQ